MAASAPPSPRRSPPPYSASSSSSDEENSATPLAAFNSMRALAPTPSSKNRQIVLTKGAWSAQEDELLLQAVSRMGDKRWSEIALSIPGRKGKQCRERYLNHLDPKLNKEPWTAEEDRILAVNQELIGNHWSEIAKLLPGRSENSVKNRFHLINKHQGLVPATNKPIPVPTLSSSSSSSLVSEPPVKKLKRVSPRPSAPNSRCSSPAPVNGDALLPLSTLATSLIAAHRSSDEFVVSSVDVKLEFDANGKAHVVNLEQPVLCLVPAFFR